jgi:uncharacterized protein YecE (DUF72 family)
VATIRIGTAGWSIPRTDSHLFPSEGSALQRYAARFHVAEINSSFHRPHRLDTWRRWKDDTPEDFRFSVKLPKTITHQAKLAACEGAVNEFLTQVEALGPKLAVLLVQLPPSLAFDAAVANGFFSNLVRRTSAAIACEPRHASWFDPQADDLLSSLGIARVAADPALSEAAARPGGSPWLAYWRLHGSPVIYRSSYADRIATYADLLQSSAAGRETWCIFDNTASSAATLDALNLRQRLAGP